MSEFIWHKDNALAPSTVPGMVRIAYRLDGDRQQRGIWRAVDVPADFAHGHDNDHLDWVLWDRLQEALHDVEGPGADLDDMCVIGAVARPSKQSTSDICDEAARMFDRLMHQNADCPHGTGDKFAHMADVMLSLSLALRDVERHAGDIDHVVESYMCDSAIYHLNEEGLTLLDPRFDNVEALTIADVKEEEFSYVVDCCEDSVADAVAERCDMDKTDIAMRIRDYRAGMATARLMRML